MWNLHNGFSIPNLSPETKIQVEHRGGAVSFGLFESFDSELWMPFDESMIDIIAWKLDHA